MRNANTEEELQVSYWSPAGYDPVALSDINWFMRDWREREQRQMDVPLLWALSALAQAAMLEGHDGKILFFSGYRTRQTNSILPGAARDSEHLRARAVDFILPGVQTRLIATYARWLGIGGVGHYPGRFIHIDTGPIRGW